MALVADRGVGGAEVDCKYRWLSFSLHIVLIMSHTFPFLVVRAKPDRDMGKAST